MEDTDGQFDDDEICSTQRNIIKTTVSYHLPYQNSNIKKTQTRAEDNQRKRNLTIVGGNVTGAATIDFFVIFPKITKTLI